MEDKEQNIQRVNCSTCMASTPKITAKFICSVCVEKFRQMEDDMHTAANISKDDLMFMAEILYWVLVLKTHSPQVFIVHYENNKPHAIIDDGKIKRIRIILNKLNRLSILSTNKTIDEMIDFLKSLKVRLK